jgi:hypothetical protein
MYFLGEPEDKGNPIFLKKKKRKGMNKKQMH